ncbi:MAG: hypothetical protein COB20_07760 [SAR86 cluster bacterium]|uniref:DUF4198 domain-containing protein n=1 Tax=SAR86 cluster bacterium TaxID=2030880 RepID=A0A2A4X4U9_9GAMM|nr:MAG: hypothetical protein COB20_07760 [SAR86 cluster bacterium]
MSKSRQIVTRALAVALMGLIAAPLYAQVPPHLRDYPLASRKASGDLVGPMFNGWIKNEDASVTMIFGFVNRNREEIVDIPLGPNNFIEPAMFDGAQPTHFPVYSRRGFVGIQERGVFAVTVPAEMADTEVVWTLKHEGYNYSIPGRATSTAYEMSAGEQALGSLNPTIRFDMKGALSIDREGITADNMTASVGKPVTLTAYAQDRGNRSDYPELEQVIFPLGTEWVLHQGPAKPDFESEKITGRDRATGSEGGTEDWTTVQTEATFWEPGEYIVRLRVDNFEAPDSKFDNQCCWSNAYIPVTVTP